MIGVTGADPGIKQGGRMASAGARAYNGGLGTEPPAGSSGRANGEAPPPLKLKNF